MSKPDLRPTRCSISARRAATPAIALSAFVAAWVLAVSEPAVGGEAFHDTNHGPVMLAQATDAGSDTARAFKVVQLDAAVGMPLYGEISSIEPIRQAADTSATGAVLGGVLGAVLGNQVGSGSGRAAATVAGGIGGAVAGNAIEKKRAENVVGYRVHVLLDGGGNRSFERPALDGLDVGARVKIHNGSLRGV